MEATWRRAALDILDALLQGQMLYFEKHTDTLPFPEMLS
jgi:hypothetical protein